MQVLGQVFRQVFGQVFRQVFRQVSKRTITTALLPVVLLLSAPQARADAEVVAASGETRIAYLSPLTNGLSALTLVWPIDHPSQDRAIALKAGLLSAVSGGTKSRSSYEIDEYLNLKGIKQEVSIEGGNLMLTVSAPNDVFRETLVHIETTLLAPDYSSGWYARQRQSLLPDNSIVTRRPYDVLNEVSDFLMYEPGDAAADAGSGKFRFGRPSQAILRSGEEEAERRTEQLIKKLPQAVEGWGSSVFEWFGGLGGSDGPPASLPKGVIHYADPESTEMLILLVKAEEFEDEQEMVKANLLVDYIGANQGSEMFRVVRQEMRAAYDPRSDFIYRSKSRAMISLSATGAAAEWPAIYEKIRGIYKTVRGGEAGETGLEIQRNKMLRRYHDYFFHYPAWTAHQYLREYPEGAQGDIRFPLFVALERASSAEIADNSGSYLPPLEDFLVILIGGGAPPAETVRSKGYCRLPESSPLRFCLDALSNGQS